MQLRRFVYVTATAAVAGPLVLPASAVVPGPNGRISVDRAKPAQKGERQGDIVTVAPDGSGAIGVRINPQQEGDAAWSPDGRRLAFSRAQGGQGRMEIALVNADGTGFGVPKAFKAFTIAPSWTPDGRILFASDKDTQSQGTKNGPPPPLQIYSMTANGTEVRRLTKTKGGLGGSECADAVASPDGLRIAMYCVTFGKDRPGNGGIFVMNADGTDRRRISPKNGLDEVNPGWSPDGRRIAFEIFAFNARPKPGQRSDIATMNPDGTDVRIIAKTKWFETNPVFSPDGTRIAFTSDRDTKPKANIPERLNNGFELYSAAVDGSDVRRLTNNKVPDVFPDWGRQP